MAGSKFGIGVAALCLWLALGTAFARIGTIPPVDGPVLAVMSTPSGTLLEDILSGRAQPGFSPVVDDGLLVKAKPGESYWLRLRLNAADRDSVRFLRIDRQAFSVLRLYQPGSPTQVLMEAGPERDSLTNSRWPDAFVLQVPAVYEYPSWIYLEVEGQGLVNLNPELLSDDQLHARERSSDRLYALLYWGLGLIIALAAFAYGRGVRPASTVVLAALLSGLAMLASNGHLNSIPGGSSLAQFGPIFPMTLWILACPPLIWASRDYAFFDKQTPAWSIWLDHAGFALFALGVASWFVKPAYLVPLQIAVFILLGMVFAACWLIVASANRRSRWLLLLVWLMLLLALSALALVMMQVVSATFMARRGFELLLALILALYLALPWFDQHMHTRTLFKRVVLDEPSLPVKIAQAREQLITGLNTGLQNAIGEDLEWIAYWRLLKSLKQVIPQVASAVVAMNEDDENIVQVELKSAQDRYALLIEQRSRLLKTLSRSKAPQQVLLDFKDSLGRTDEVRLAIIPMPMGKPGWGALLIERHKKHEYSQDELDLCAEFAALACTAWEEAASAVQTRRIIEIDTETGFYRQDVFESMAEMEQLAAYSQRKPLSMVRIAIDGVDALAPPVLSQVMLALADIIREKIDQGDLVGRLPSNELLLLLPGRPLVLSRELAERIRTASAKVPAPGLASGFLVISIGLSHLQPGERTGDLMKERTIQALAKAREYGGNQVQSISSATS